jgi:hypothetical protein
LSGRPTTACPPGRAPPPTGPSELLPEDLLLFLLTWLLVGTAPPTILPRSIATTGWDQADL